ncbi:MAG: tRNA lysidine(34) synthetase TilS, partial [Pseudomonadota bacterium]
SAVKARLLAVEADRIVVAYSGGLDSSVLLHTLAQSSDLGMPLEAVHIDHGLQGAQLPWRTHIETVTSALGVPLEVIEITLTPAKGESIEAVARQGRYQALAGLAGRPLIVLAQHQDDQAETFLLQLLRGAGPKGLAAMPDAFFIGDHPAMRPLLAIDREGLSQFAKAMGIEWFDDPSNQDQRFDRNYLRSEVMPTIRARWPSASTTISRAASLQAETTGVIAQQATGDSRYVNWDGHSFSASQCQHLPESRQRNLVRFLLATCGLPVPSLRRLTTVIGLLNSNAARGEVCWADVAARRYRDRVFLELVNPDVPSDFETDVIAGVWIPLPGDLGQICVSGSTLNHGASTVRFRRGGERVRPYERGPSMPLARWFQQRGVPPWRRQQLPLVIVDAKVAAVGDTVFEGFGDLRVTWERPSG